MNEQMTKHTPTELAGIHTRADLQSIEYGWESLATLKRSLRTNTVWRIAGDLRHSRQEAIIILEQQQGIKKTPKDLIAQMSEYQCDIRYIEREPDRYVAPEKVRAWYEQQIERIRKLLHVASEEQL